VNNKISKYHLPHNILVLNWPKRVKTNPSSPHTTARIAFLCSPEAAFVSGAVVHIDGDYHLQIRHLPYALSLIYKVAHYWY
jgi:hypothetical protein